MEIHLRTREIDLGDRKIVVYELTQSEVEWLRFVKWLYLAFGFICGAASFFVYLVFTLPG